MEVNASYYLTYENLGHRINKGNDRKSPCTDFATIGVSKRKFGLKVASFQTFPCFELEMKVESSYYVTCENLGHRVDRKNPSHVPRY